MDLKFKELFLNRWEKFFPETELPVVYFYSDDAGSADKLQNQKNRHCFINDLGLVRQGRDLCFDLNTLACTGAKRYLGFSHSLRPNFNYFLSCGIPGRVRGERYKKTPELVKESMTHMPPFEAPGRYIIFKRWDKLTAADEPLVAVIFATPDVLAGLFTLANFDETNPNSVIAPFGAGCASLVHYPYLELLSPRPRAVLGMFDISARPYVEDDKITFAAPWSKFERMVHNMEESFLITGSWREIQQRLTGK